jgi:hypothetical protein
LGRVCRLQGPTEYARQCFAEYGLAIDASGWFGALYRPSHLIGLELGISVASVALRGEPTGCASGFRGDAVAVAKRDLALGEILDGEGGYTVWGRLLPARESLSQGALPIGLAHGVALRRRCPPEAWFAGAMSSQMRALKHCASGAKWKRSSRPISRAIDRRSRLARAKHLPNPASNSAYSAEVQLPPQLKLLTV